MRKLQEKEKLTLDQETDQDITEISKQQQMVLDGAQSKKKG